MKNKESKVYIPFHNLYYQLGIHVTFSVACIRSSDGKKPGLAMNRSGWAAGSSVRLDY